MAHPIHVDDGRSRLLARLTREVLATPEAAEFTTIGDLIDALKTRCAKLRIGWTNDDITAALRIVASNVPLPGARVLASRHRRMIDRERALQHRISRAEASAILHRLGVQV